ncbi:unnamed protein product [Trichogramma brassicae]|uniref:Uncharacterized protein n=1 Tax=Trichogramma brassicae TaxID=86971 RepID=A0A6H5I9I8_9HYME|nr:unnamed protein product [Trichogramma brassicae]
MLPAGAYDTADSGLCLAREPLFALCACMDVRVCAPWYTCWEFESANRRDAASLQRFRSVRALYTHSRRFGARDSPKPSPYAKRFQNKLRQLHECGIDMFIRKHFDEFEDKHGRNSYALMPDQFHINLNFIVACACILSRVQSAIDEALDEDPIVMRSMRFRHNCEQWLRTNNYDSNTENSSSLIDLTEEFNPVETCITHPHHCKNVYKYLVYMKSSSLWMRRLDRPEPSNPILMKFQVFTYVDLYHLAGIEYSEKRKSFFYADCLHFREVPALDLDNEIDFMTKNSSRQCFGYLAYDDKVGTIFYIVYQVHLKMYALIKHDMTKKNDDRGVQLMKLNHERPIAVVIHEDKALVFLASISKETNRGWIEKMDYFGQGGKVDLDEDVR